MNQAPSDVITPLVRFLRHPVLRERPPGRLTPWHWLGWLCFLALASGAGGVVVAILNHWFGWTSLPPGIYSYVGSHPSVAAAMIVLLAPTLEELAFRAFLSTSPKAVFTGLAFFLTYLYLSIAGYFGAGNATDHVTMAFAIRHYFDHFWVLLPAGAASWLLCRYACEPVMALFRRHGAWVFWISCVLFGAMHATVYSDDLVWWAFVLTLPQFLAGVGLAYLRVTFGLPWSIAAHLAMDGSIFVHWLLLVMPVGSAPRIAVSAFLAVLAVGAFAYGLVAIQRVARGYW